MKTYVVGGAVRDKLLGRQSRDRDFIVTNVKHHELLEKGFIPVGKDHAVYLHPVTKDEYTVAENLLEDLGRRDLTLNAMALDGDNLIDPYQGQLDIRNKTLRHVKAENFFHDPLRVYRVVRFASELPHFHIDPSTRELLASVIKEKEFSHVTPERILKELEKVLKSEKPSIFFRELKQLGALPLHFKELALLNSKEWEHTLSLLNKIRTVNNPCASYGTLFIHTSGSAPENLSDRLLVSNPWKKAASIIQEVFLKLQEELTAEEWVNIFYQIDAYRNSPIVTILSDLLKSDGNEGKSKILLESFHFSKDISVKDLSAELKGKELGTAIKQERMKRLTLFLSHY